jgi:hypothetical protein
MQLAPVLDIAGTLQKDQALGLEQQRVGVLQSANQREQFKLDREIGKENQLNAQMPDLLKKYRGGDENAFMQIAQLSPQMAETLMKMDEAKQVGALRGLQMQQTRAAIVAQAKAQKVQVYTQELKAITGLQSALDGVESPAEKTRILKAYRQQVEKAGIGIPDLLKGDWTPEMDKDLDNLVTVGGATLKALQAPAEAFTLGEGQARYSGDGTLIASRETGASGADVKGEGDLRKEFEGMQKEFREVERAKGRIDAAAKEPSAAGDIALVFSYMKMLDPGSTVREGEYATAQNAAGVPDMIRAKWNKLQDGETLAPTQRADFVKRSQGIYRAAAEGFNKQVDRYRGLAGDYGYNADRIVKPVELPKDESEVTDGGELPPQNMDPNLWKHMTPEERSLFK